MPRPEDAKFFARLDRAAKRIEFSEMHPAALDAYELSEAMVEHGDQERLDDLRAAAQEHMNEMVLFHRDFWLYEEGDDELMFHYMESITHGG